MGWINVKLSKQAHDNLNMVVEATGKSQGWILSKIFERLDVPTLIKQAQKEALEEAESNNG